jgi:hypothetical protein
MKPKTIRVVIIGVSLFILIISLTQTAIIIDYNGIKPVNSIDYFLMGSTAILGGGLLEWLIWLANPLALFTIIHLAKGNKKALITCVPAIILSCSFIFWKEILGSESGSMAKIISFESGYYLWVCSIVILSLGTFYYFRTFNDSKNSLV